MFYLVYVSNATRPLGSPELMDILRVSQESNTQIGITGLLLYKDGNFMQLLEGREHTVRGLLEKITRDPRHYNVVTLQEGTKTEREFSEWAMGFRRLDDEPMELVPGYQDFAKVSLTGDEFRENPSRCLGLLRLFKEHA